LTQNAAKFCRKWIIALVFKKKSFCGKLVKIAENCDYM
jgi:hypothetical protein